MGGLVSVVVPCYNGEAFLPRFFDSILNQSYTRLELILINDGSTDGSEEVVEAYKERLKKHCERFIYAHQKNEGRVAAINSGLALVSGDYLVWSDVDDFFMANSIEKRVTFLEQHSDYAMVCCRGYIVSEDLKEIIRYVKQTRKEESDVEEIIRKGIYPAAGFYLVRASIFFDYYKCRQIINSKFGQNWQMLLPFLIKYKCGYLEDALFTVVKTNHSISRRERTPEEVRARYEGIENLIIEVICQMEDPNEEAYIQLVRRYYSIIKVKLKA